MPNPQLILSEIEGNTSPAGRCSLCQESFSANASAVTDPILGQRELRDLFNAHVKQRHSWRADANQTAALRLRKMMEEFGE
jgi:hypothetical protein